MSRYKRLNLEFPYNYLKDAEWWLELLKEEKHFEKMIKIVPVFGRDGWYYDRKLNISWIETRQGAWQEKSPEMFKHYLSNYMHTRIPNKVIKAIKVLMNYKMCPRNLMKLMLKEQYVRKLEDTHRSIRKTMLKSTNS